MFVRLSFSGFVCKFYIETNTWVFVVNRTAAMLPSMCLMTGQISTVISVCICILPKADE